jgi:hypothetical protein
MKKEVTARVRGEGEKNKRGVESTTLKYIIYK